MGSVIYPQGDGSLADGGLRDSERSATDCYQKHQREIDAKNRSDSQKGGSVNNPSLILYIGFIHKV